MKKLAPLAAAALAAGLAACHSSSSSAPAAKSSSAAPAAAPAVSGPQACRALASWERGSSSGSVAKDAALAADFRRTVQPLSRDFAAWTAGILRESAGDNANAGRVSADCAAYGISIFPPVPSDSAPPPPAAASSPAAPSLSAAQQQAVDAARGYLSLGTGFSKAGLVQQLTSSAGNGFARADAGFAVGYLHPDWDAQALDAAKGYLNLGGFSRASLLQQLTSPYGGQFTQAQAEYAVNAVGL